MLLLALFTSASAWAQFVWLGSSGKAQVQTGMGNETHTEGYWFTYGDDADGGESKVVWDAEPGDDYSLTPIVEAFGGISGTIVISRGIIPTTSNSPRAGVGFNIVGETSAEDADPVPGDASAWEGIAIAYTCDADAELLLGLGDFDSTIGYANPYVTLPMSTEVNVLRFRWSDFVQPEWYKSYSPKISGEEAATKLVAVMFQITKQADYEEFHFNITGIGSYDAYETLLEASKPKHDCSVDGHTWGEWSTVAEPSCTEDGKEERTCTSCNATDTQAIPALGHDWNANGVCSRCGLEMEKPDAIESLTSTDTTDGAWYTLTGNKLQGEPTAPGIYVKDGKRIAIR